jgi:hypothetical protein
MVHSFLTCNFSRVENGIEQLNLNTNDRVNELQEQLNAFDKRYK